MSEGVWGGMGTPGSPAVDALAACVAACTAVAGTVIMGLHWHHKIVPRTPRLAELQNVLGLWDGLRSTPSVVRARVHPVEHEEQVMAGHREVAPSDDSA